MDGRELRVGLDERRAGSLPFEQRDRLCGEREMVAFAKAQRGAGAELECPRGRFRLTSCA